MQQKTFLAGMLSLAILGAGCSRSAENKAMENEKALISPGVSPSSSPDRVVGNKNNGSSASAPAASPPANPIAGTPKSQDDDDHDEKKEDKGDLKKRHK